VPGGWEIVYLLMLKRRTTGKFDNRVRSSVKKLPTHTSPCRHWCNKESKEELLNTPMHPQKRNNSVLVFRVTKQYGDWGGSTYVGT